MSLDGSGGMSTAFWRQKKIDLSFSSLLQRQCAPWRVT